MIGKEQFLTLLKKRVDLSAFTRLDTVESERTVEFECEHESSTAYVTIDLGHEGGWKLRKRETTVVGDLVRSYTKVYQNDDLEQRAMAMAFALPTVQQ